MQIQDVDFRLLRLFVSVVQSGGFTRAADHLNVGRPTVSTQMADLESRLGMRLCERGRSGFSLTEHGEQVYERALGLLAAVDEFGSDMDAIQGHLSGELNLGQIDYMTSLSEFNMSGAVRRFCERAPDVVLNLEVLPEDAVQRGVLDGRLHLGIIGSPTRLAGLDVHEFLDENLYLYCSQEHPLFETPDKSITTRHLARYRMAGSTIDTDLNRTRLANDARANNLEAVLILILSGQYMGYLPDHFAQSWVDDGRIRAIKPRLTHRYNELPLITRSRARKSPQLDLFLSILMQSSQRVAI